MRSQAVSADFPPSTVATAAESVVSPHFFIIAFPGPACARLKRILGAHPQVAIAPSLRWSAEHFQTRKGPNFKGLMTHELLHKWVEQDRFAPFQIDRMKLRRSIAAGDLLAYRVFLTRLYDLYAQAKGKKVVGTEILGHVRILPALRDAWPSAKFVHLIQDGRQACIALEQYPQADLTRVRRYSTWTQDRLLTMALWWRKRELQARRAACFLEPHAYYQSRYEELQADPVAECARLCAFLRIPYDEAMLRKPGELAPDSAESSQEWQSEMAAESLERFEAAAGDLLDELGYPRSFPHPGSESVLYATQLRHAFGPAQPEAEATAIKRARRNRTNPFVFIVGCPRSGTTLLQRILDAHPEIAIPPETFWIPYFFKNRIGITEDGLVTDELIPQLFDYYKFYRMKLDQADVSSLTAGGPISYAAFVTGVFDLHGEVRGKPFVGDKTPDYARNIPVLHRLWPEARFVHLIRDGRDVCLSAINWKRKVAKLAKLHPTWSSHPVTTAALWWEWHVRQGRESGSELGQSLYYELRYEALVGDPVGECAKLCEFLGVPYDEAMRHFEEGRTKNDSSLDAKNAWLPIMSGLRNWRQEMPLPYVECFESAAGTLLRELNYPLEFSAPAPQALAHAREIRGQFADNVRALADWLP